MKTESFKTFSAVMIAVVTVVSALVTWRVSVAAQGAGDADFGSLVTTVNAGEARTLNTITVMEHHEAFISYTRNNKLGDLLYDALQTAPENAGELEQQKSDAWGIAYGLQAEFFPARYLLPDGTYDSQRELDEAWADARQKQDTRSDLYASRADTLRNKANLLAGMLIVLGVSFWFFTLAQITEHKVKYLFALGGGFFLMAGMLVVLVIEVWM